MKRIFLGSFVVLISCTALSSVKMSLYKDKQGKVLLTEVKSDNNKKYEDREAKRNTYYIGREDNIDEKMPNYNNLPLDSKRLAVQHLNLMKYNRKRKIKVGNIDEFVKASSYGVDDDVDVGAKIGMSKDEVSSQTHWGFRVPDYKLSTSDEMGELEQWYYNGLGALYFDNGKLISIQSFE